MDFNYFFIIHIDTPSFVKNINKKAPNQATLTRDEITRGTTLIV